MNLVVAVHGIGQQGKGEDVLYKDWLPALLSGLRRAGDPGVRALQLLNDQLFCAFYGDLFRPAGRALSVGDPFLTAADATVEDRELLGLWWQGASAVEPAVPSPDGPMLSYPSSVQAALNALSRSRFFAGIGDRALLFDLAQVRMYFTDAYIRAEALVRVEAAVTSETRVMVGHSLGSVVAYEALCAHPEWNVRALVTLGSPLGIRNLIFERLTPAPEPFPQPGHSGGRWPGSVRTWSNIADSGDVVALVKDLRPQFGRNVHSNRQFQGFLVDNGVHAHDVSPYLTARETGAAVAAGLLGDV